MNDYPDARLLNADPSVVMCGWACSTCTGRIGTISHEGVVSLGDGWVRRYDGGVALTDRAKRRLARGDAPANRRGPQAGRDRRESLMFEPGAMVAQPQLYEAALVECPQCGQKNRVDPAALALDFRQRIE